ncbi:MAG: glycoside hydrolase [Rubritepida sp.]|nr:glycoside hydrolase [Rubritepida sp.]
MLRVLTLSTLFPNIRQPTFGVFVESQTLALAARPGVEVRVINPIPMPPFPLNLHERYRALRDLPREENWKGLRVARPPMRVVPGLSGRFNPGLLAQAARGVLRQWREEGFDFDLIDAQFFYPDGPAAAQLGAEFDVPISIKARGADVHYWGSRRGCRERILEAAAQAGGLLAVSKSLSRDMAAMGMDPEKIAVHYTGCDLERFCLQDRVAAKAQLGVTGPLVVSLGALIPRKGHALVIEAMAELPGVTLLVAGAGPDHARLAALISARKLETRVRLLGSLPHAQLPPILAAADVMALASESEGLANAWIEAMACGTPVVTPDVDGAPEAIDRPAAGRLLQERTPAAIATAIRSILADPPTPAAVRACAERFTWQRNALQLQQHLERVAEAQPRRPPELFAAPHATLGT